MKDSEKILSENKVSITNPRIIVLESLLENRNPITVDELQSKLKNKVAKSTLYRVGSSTGGTTKNPSIEGFFIGPILNNYIITRVTSSSISSRINLSPRFSKKLPDP